MSYWTDSHAHIYLKEFKEDREAMIHRASIACVDKIYMPNIDTDSIDDMLAIESTYPKQCIAMMGLHPCSVKKDFEKQLYVVEDWLNRRSFAAIGEMGTDLYWDKTFWEQQREAFRVQANWARKYELPMVIHCRESLDETIALLSDLQDGKLKGIFHCFTGTTQQAERINKIGFHLGLGGVATFKNSGLDSVIPNLNNDFIVLETDSPYLSPVPYRGKRNEPSYIPKIADHIAKLKKMDISELQKQTTNNAERLFNKS